MTPPTPIHFDEVRRIHRQSLPNSCSVSAFEFVSKLFGLLLLDKYPLQSIHANQGRGFAEPNLQSEVGLFATSDREDYDIEEALGVLIEETNQDRLPIISLRAFREDGSPAGYHINVVASRDGELVLIEPADGTIRAGTTEGLKMELEQSCHPSQDWPRNTLHILTTRPRNEED